MSNYQRRRKEVRLSLETERLEVNYLFSSFDSQVK